MPELKRSRITLVEWDLEGKFLLVVESRFNLFQGFLGMSRLHWVLWKIISIAQRSIYSEKMVNQNWILGCPFTIDSGGVSLNLINTRIPSRILCNYSETT